MTHRPDWTDLDRRRYEALLRLAENLVDLLATFDPARSPAVSSSGHAQAPDKLLTVKQAAEQLGVSMSVMYEMVHRTDGLGVPHVRLGRTFRISRRALEKWIDETGRDTVARRQTEVDTWRHRKKG